MRSPDPEGLITAGHDATTGRQIAIYQDEQINAKALKQMFKAIIARNRGRAPYRLVPLLVDKLSHRMITATAKAHTRATPMTFNGESLARGDPASRDAVARYLLRSALADRAHIHGTPLRVRLTSFIVANDVEADVLVDWSPEFAVDRVDWVAPPSGAP